MPLTPEQLEKVLNRIRYDIHTDEDLEALESHLTTLEADRARMDWLDIDGGGAVEMYYRSCDKGFRRVDDRESEPTTLRALIDKDMKAAIQGEKKV